MNTSVGNSLNVTGSSILRYGSVNISLNNSVQQQQSYQAALMFESALLNFSSGIENLSTTTTASVTETSATECSKISELPESGNKEEVHNSINILLMLFVIALCFLEIYFLLISNFHFVPESFIVVCTGAALGLVFTMICGHPPGETEKKKETFNPTTFFLFMLPPIIYESAYNLNKGNFFKNIGSILVFAIIGTGMSAFTIGGCLFWLGKKNVIYELSFTESFAFGSFLSSVDPVATLAVFYALDVEPVLNMLVIGESILNDAVAIVLSSAVWEASKKESLMNIPISGIILECIVRFLIVFVTSAAVGIVFALIAALLFKHLALNQYPSLEFGMILIFIYAPYCLAEVLQISGILALLFNGIVMSQYTHYNLSRNLRHTMQVTLRSAAFISETCVFAYLGLSIFSFKIAADFYFILATLLLCLVARAVSVFPLSVFVNIFRQHKISPKMMFIIWFSAIRGAVAYACSLKFEFEENKRNLIITTTLVIVLFTTIVFGGSTMPLLKYLQWKEKDPCKKKIAPSSICLIKTDNMGKTIIGDKESEIEESGSLTAQNLFMKLDTKYLTPFFTRTQECHQISWYPSI
ncbi:sodium/hydrogen exchanger 8-like isoform X2 [Parasteatoda tepidariorum]|uniref:sodium/hydrogen exchanger 8-like isoform X2 n=1 Tax=Parasteatoda tepidariorum TaxID=114398 RepID=UPI0039BC6400